MELYTPVLALLALAAGFAIFSVAMSAVTGPARANRARLDAYECGIEPAPQPYGGGRIPVKYYTIAMTFIIFDVEIMFLVPWAIYFDELAWFGVLAVFLFLFNITLAYVYEWRRGGLDWD
ncbi:NADH-quinone oxidoreductase subunit A [Nocardioides limicola]|uniref:NADH-quinone oxidoreductase subunit A n=1 Tax=Nocardioides limicola TaxID=2803368 RepID=UPI00193BBDB8|nr:NADH-quinone oxidoreductase subunit A [Nocardioides sp. DJM-14]